MQIFGLKNCDTCRKAKKHYPNATLVDVRQDPLEDAILARAVAQFGDSIVNRSSKTWRDLTDADRAQTPEQIIRAHPAVMKRPLILHDDDQLTLGFKPA